MKKILFFFLVAALCACKEHPFRGELYRIAKSENIIENKPDTSIKGEIPYAFYMGIKDSLAIFHTHKDKFFMFEIYDMKNKRSCGKFGPIGHGHKEVSITTAARQFFEEEGQVKSYLYEPNKEEVLIWNISASLEEGKTVYDSIIPYKEDNDFPIGYSDWFSLGKKNTLVNRTSVPDMLDNINPDVWQVRSFPDTALVRNIQLFNNIDNRQGIILPEAFFSAPRCVKPDYTQFANAMCWLPQINIVDIQSGKAKGFLLRGMDDYDIFQTDMMNLKYYYADIQSDNDHIFALWCGEQAINKDQQKGMEEVHVFNWKGNMLGRIKLSTPTDRICLDVENKLLYAYHTDHENLYCYKIPANLGEE